METRVVSHLHPEGSYDPADHEVPKGLEEIWRFTPLKRLRDLHKDAPLDGHDYEVDLDVAPEVQAGSVDIDDPARGTSTYVPVDRISARAWEASDRLFKVTVPAEAVASQPTWVRFRGNGAEKAGAGHVVITAEPFSKATVVIDYVGSATWAENVEIVLGDGAQLTVVAVQDWDDDAVHVSHHHAHVGRDASLKHVLVSFGGDLVRINASVEYAGTGGNVDMLGLYFADAGQHLEHRLFVDHNNPKGRSRVEYKGALQGKDAHTVWIGDVLIRKEGVGIDTYESNDNLVLTDGARADSVPNLEIETGEIEGAGHASTTGRFDDQHLFYLQSRGIPEVEARRLVVHGFFNDVIRRTGVPEIQARLLETVEAELAKHVGVAQSIASEA
ncbi:Fe-S cluster assembly protein SufD [Mumia zhuanghuii]|uniref:Fe-S cluster assembly protein SufD n=1 Tax=Mumia zhuanghuii TaxID=2585211 RepID=A0A5Q6RQ50_9ACTN|nr:Fe-S cluster assembly protein SufD [Mumia zhuanghuii]KAA1420144.1 Fe-S cluster assembly protein SufD [Mumia zhuanghuii]